MITLSDIKALEKDVERQNKLKAWRRYIDYLRSDFHKQELDGEPIRRKTHVNLVFATIRTEIAILHIDSPIFVVKVIDPTAAVAGKAWVKILEYLWEETNMSAETRLTLQDALMFGFGALKVGIRHIAEQPMDVRPPSASEPWRVPYASDRLWVRRVAPWDILFDPAVSRIGDSGFVVHRTVKQIEDVKRNARYSRTSDLKASPPQGLFEEQRRSHVVQNLVTIYEIYDREEGTITTYADGVDLPIRDPEPFPVVVEGFYPFVFLTFSDDPESPYPLSEIQVIEQQQLMENRIRTRQMRHVDRFNRKYQMPKNTLDKKNKSSLIAGEDGTIIEYEGGGIAEPIRPIQDAPLSSDVYMLNRANKADIYEILGLSEYQRGMAGRAETATEAAITQAGAQTRVGEKSAIYQRFLKSVCEMMRAYTIQFGDRPFYVNLGIEGAAEKIESADILGEYDVNILVRPGSTGNVDLWRKQMTDIYLLARQDPALDARPILKAILQSAGIFDPEVFSPPAKLPPVDLQKTSRLQRAIGERGNMADTAGAAEDLGEGIRQPVTAEPLGE